MARFRSESDSRNKAPLTAAETNSLLFQARGGNEDALETLIKRNNGWILNAVHTFFQSGAVKGYAPDDVLQIARMEYLNSIKSGTFDPDRGSFGPYARTSLKRGLINALKARRSVDDFCDLEDVDEGDVAEEIADPFLTTPEESVEFGEFCCAVRSAVENLQSYERQLLADLLGVGSDDDKTGMNQTRLAKERGVSRQAISAPKVRLMKRLAEIPYFRELWDEYLKL